MKIKLDVTVGLVRKSTATTDPDDLVVDREGVAYVVDVTVAGKTVRAKETTPPPGFERGGGRTP